MSVEEEEELKIQSTIKPDTSLIIAEKRDKRLLSNESGSISNPSKSAHLSETESKLVTFIESLLKKTLNTESDTAMHHTLIFLPVGIPGMGKTTLGRFLESAAHNVKLVLPNSSQPASVNFIRVSYDVVFTQLQVDYTKSNPECD